jgi:hypothetical protein
MKSEKGKRWIEEDREEERGSIRESPASKEGGGEEGSGGLANRIFLFSIILLRCITCP